MFFCYFSSRRQHTISKRDWSSDVCSSDLGLSVLMTPSGPRSIGCFLFSKLFIFADGVKQIRHIINKVMYNLNISMKIWKIYLLPVILSFHAPGPMPFLNFWL